MYTIFCRIKSNLGRSNLVLLTQLSASESFSHCVPEVAICHRIDDWVHHVIKKVQVIRYLFLWTPPRRAEKVGKIPEDGAWQIRCKKAQGNEKHDPGCAPVGSWPSGLVLCDWLCLAGLRWFVWGIEGFWHGPHFVVSVKWLTGSGGCCGIASWCGRARRLGITKHQDWCIRDVGLVDHNHPRLAVRALSLGQLHGPLVILPWVMTWEIPWIGPMS